MTLHSEVVDISPEQAYEWLTGAEYAGPNRNVNPATVARYARRMSAGGWRLTGEAIKFGESGRLLDGQHRLTAIFESGHTVRILVVRGVEDAAQDVMDTNRLRRAGDVLAIHGKRNTTIVAAAARLLISMDRTGTIPLGGNRMGDATTDEVLEYVQAHPELETLADDGLWRGQLPMPPSAYLAGLVLVARVDGDAASEFDAAFRTGAGLERGNPILTLRERLIQAQARREKLSTYVLLCALLRTWNAWRTGQEWHRFLFYTKGIPIQMPEGLK